MQISRSVGADWPTNRLTSSLRCSGCCPIRPAFSCCGRSRTESCRSTSWPDEWGKPGPSVSQHLAKLRMARLVRTRREGTQVFYRLENDHVRQLVTDAVYNAEHAAGGVPAHHLDDAELRLLHQEGTG